MAWRRSWIHWGRSGAGEVPCLTILVGAKVVRLNEVAAMVWQDLEAAGDARGLFRLLRRRFSAVEDRRLWTDVLALLEAWRREGWIEWQEDPVFAVEEELWPP